MKMNDAAVKAENDRKDLIIMKLKAEVFELRQKERDYKRLHEEYVQMEHRQRQSANEKKRVENSLALKMEN